MSDEQRKHDRHLIKTKTFVALGSGYTRVGGIRDISLGGMAFEYYYHKHLNYEPVDRLDIFSPKDCCYLASVPCNIVYDETVYETTHPLFIIKRCGIKFGELKAEQIEQLQTFIKTHTEIHSSAEHNLQAS